MEQKTEASQAVHFPPLPEPDHSLDNGTQPYFTAIQMFAYVRAALKAQLAPTDPYQLDDDDDARFPNDTNVVILHIDRYWHLRGCEDICAALDAKPAPTEAQGKPAWAPAYLSGTVLQNTNSGGGKVTLQFDTVGSAAAAFEDFIVMQEGKAQLSGNSGELQPSGNTGELAQGEDSARLDAAHARLLAAVKVYSNGYMQDEAADEEDCVCGAAQHAEAKEVFAAIVEVERASAETGGVKS